MTLAANLSSLVATIGADVKSLRQVDLTKAPIDSPTFTGTVSGVTKSMVGLGSADNTSDLAKPISTATQIAINDAVAMAVAFG